VCELVGVKTIELTGLDPPTLTDQERAFGDYRPGRKALLLANIRALLSPIRARDGQGLWIPDAATVAAVKAQLGVRV
jgi:hypothetical protein